MARAASPLPRFLDRPPPGWHPRDVWRIESRKWDWVALFVFAGQNHSAWVRVPGKHRNKEAAWVAAQEMVAVRH